MASEKLLYPAETDLDVLQRVKGSLNLSGHSTPQSLEVCVEQGVVVVQGQVPTFYLRQVTIECLKHIAVISEVVDLIRVVEAPVQPPVTDSLVDLQKSPVESTRNRADVVEMVGTASAEPESLFRRHHLLSTAK